MICVPCTAVAETLLRAAVRTSDANRDSPKSFMNQAAEIKSDCPSRALSWKDVKMDYDQVGDVLPYRLHAVD